MTFRSFFKKIRFTNFFRPYFAFHSFNKLRMEHPVFPFFTAVCIFLFKHPNNIFWDQGPNSAGSQFFSTKFNMVCTLGKVLSSHHRRQSDATGPRGPKAPDLESAGIAIPLTLRPLRAQQEGA